MFFWKTLILQKKNQQTTKHYKHDKLLIKQRVNEFIEKQHILFHLVIEITFDPNIEVFKLFVKKR